MFGDFLQPTHLLFILIVALLVLGPKRLPEAGRSLGRGLRDFRDAVSGDHFGTKELFSDEPRERTPAPPPAPRVTTTDGMPTPEATLVEDEPTTEPETAHDFPSEPVVAQSAAPDPEPAVAHGPASEPAITRSAPTLDFGRQLHEARTARDSDV